MSFFFYINKRRLTYIDNVADNMFINFNFATEPYSKRINTLLAMDVGRVTGGEIASFFYKYYVQGISISEMGIRDNGFKNQVRIIINAKDTGAYAVNKLLFDYCVKHYRDQLDRLFNVKTVKEGHTDER